MELYLLRPEEHHRLYGCINISVDEVPLEKRQHVTEGFITIVLAAIYYILYIPCIISIYRHMQFPCYKLLFYISIVDCSILWAVGFAHGYFAITGVVFCSYPTFIYIVGCYFWGTWIFETSGQTMLVINRCVSMLSSEIEMLMFGGKRIWLWFSASITCGLYGFFCVKPILFTGIYFSWFMNPYVGYREDPEENYVTSFFSLWDGSFAVVVPLLYIVFFILFFAKTHGIKSSEKISKQQKMMLLQVFVISLLNFITSFSFISMMYFVPAESFVIFAQFCWLHIHGLPPVIYLVFNPTIRKDSKKMLYNLLNRCKGNKVNEVTTVASKTDGRNTNTEI